MRWNILNQPLGSVCSTGCPTKKEMPWLIPAIVAGVSSLASAGIGAAGSAAANRKAQDRLAAEKAQTEAERRAAKYKTLLDTQSGQNLYRMLQQQADREYKRMSGAAQVGGATDAAVAAEKELQNQKQAEIIAQASAAHEDKKDAVDASYRQQLSGLNQQQIALDREKGQNVAKVAGAAASAFGNAAAAALTPKLMGDGSPAGQGVTPKTGPTQEQIEMGYAGKMPYTPKGDINSQDDGGGLLGNIGNNMFKHNFGRISSNSSYIDYIRNLTASIYN